MEGKGVLFKKFAGINVFDIELAELDPDKLVDIIASLEPTFGGINLEDIKAPECFYIEKKLRERMKIPVFHDDQARHRHHRGRAILNGLRVVEQGHREGESSSASGAGAAALACLDMLVALGFSMENIWVTDIAGVVTRAARRRWTTTRPLRAQDGRAQARPTSIADADIFLGSRGRVS
jgi:malate dehydrogenase (oxaloacetate-decarboxylating)(NADP+)